MWAVQTTGAARWQSCVSFPLDAEENYHKCSPGGSDGNLPAVKKTWVWFLGGKDPLEEEMATGSSILIWRIPWTEEPGGLQFMGSQRVVHNWMTNVFFQQWDMLSHSLEVRVWNRSHGAKIKAAVSSWRLQGRVHFLAFSISSKHLHSLVPGPLLQLHTQQLWVKSFYTVCHSLYHHISLYATTMKTGTVLSKNHDLGFTHIIRIISQLKVCNCFKKRIFFKIFVWLGLRFCAWATL